MVNPLNFPMVPPTFKATLFSAIMRYSFVVFCLFVKIVVIIYELITKDIPQAKPLPPHPTTESLEGKGPSPYEEDATEKTVVTEHEVKGSGNDPTEKGNGIAAEKEQVVGRNGGEDKPEKDDLAKEFDMEENMKTIQIKDVEGNTESKKKVQNTNELIEVQPSDEGNVEREDKIKLEPTARGERNEAQNVKDTEESLLHHGLGETKTKHPDEEDKETMQESTKEDLNLKMEEVQNVKEEAKELPEHSSEKYQQMQTQDLANQRTEPGTDSECNSSEGADVEESNKKQEDHPTDPAAQIKSQV